MCHSIIEIKLEHVVHSLEKIKFQVQASTPCPGFFIRDQARGTSLSGSLRANLSLIF
jgi:hypothetical protein